MLTGSEGSQALAVLGLTALATAAMSSRRLRHLLAPLRPEGLSQQRGPPQVATATVAGTPEEHRSGQNRIDTVRPDAPELAKHGPHRVGVRTIRATNPSQLDAVASIAAAAEGGGEIVYDRELTLEVAVRDAAPLSLGSGDPRPPLVIISHGYPGNRYLLSHLAENLATKNYVVVSIDHRDSTYDNPAAFGSTLLNRPLDQLFVLNHIAELASQDPSAHFLGGLVDTERTGLVGYSMGGYGATVTAGGGVTQAAVEQPGRPRLGSHLSGSAEHLARFDDRIKAVMSFAPWGMGSGFWDDAALAGVRVPTLLVAGSVDTTSGYEHGVAAMFEKMVNVERYFLTFENAGHNAGAPMPAPTESWAFSPALPHLSSPAVHYADAVWDSVRMNNVAQHFATAWFGAKLRGEAEAASHLAVGDGAWPGFEEGQHAGLSLQRRPAGP